MNHCFLILLILLLFNIIVFLIKFLHLLPLIQYLLMILLPKPLSNQKPSGKDFQQLAPSHVPTNLLCTVKFAFLPKTVDKLLLLMSFTWKLQPISYYVVKGLSPAVLLYITHFSLFIELSHQVGTYFFHLIIFS